MNLPTITGEAIRALQANRLRTALTMLGMIIGVAAVVLMLSIGQGAQTRINDAIASMGSHLLIVTPGATSAGGLRFGSGSVKTLTTQDAQAIAELSTVMVSAPIVTGTAQLNFGANNWSTFLNGVTPEYFSVSNWQMQSGEIFTDSDLRAGARVTVLGAISAKNLFGDEDPVGQIIRIADRPFTVTGVLAAKGQALDGRDQDDRAFVPLTTAQRQVLGNQFPGSVNYMLVQATSGDSMEAAQHDITGLLRQRHRLTDGLENDFTVRNLTALASVASSAAKVMSWMLGAIASISLLVGGIGIMNIMLVSVTERTREIGIRMAIGASRRVILMQFLLEAMMICILGALIGILLGAGGAWLVSEIADIQIVITMGMIGLAVSFASIIGIFFGIYPARKASSLKPVDALRHE
ncbi:MAG: ABC transporter permease [Nitrosomonas sp.]|nr:ABC transporter permease [Nitrosomonas sp.]